MTIGDRLRQLRKEQGLTQLQMADIAGTSKQYVSQLELGRNQTPNGEYLEAWARHFGVSMRWLATGVGPKVLKASTDDGWENVSAYDQALALGAGTTPDEYAEANKLKFRTESLRRQGLLGRRLEIYYGTGDSMEPTIKDGDAILIDRDDTSPKDGSIFLLHGDTGATIKRLLEIGGQWFVVADHRDHPQWRKPVPLHGKKPFEIQGRVRWVAGWED